MYYDYFGFKEAPFSIAPDPRYLYMGDQHREALAHLMYGVRSDGGFVLLTGEVGTGKTTVCRGLLEQLPEDAEIAFIFNPKLSAPELLGTICDELGIEHPSDASVKLLIDRIYWHLLQVHAQGRNTVLIIDEAQNLEADVLEQIRLLTNLETNTRKLLQIIMIGQPELREKLDRPELRQLAQRITARYHLGPLSRADLEAYVPHRLAVAGLRTELFPPRIMPALHRMSGGTPRLVNVICDRALLGAYVRGQRQVDRTTLRTAAREVLGDRRPMVGSMRGWGVAASLALGVTASALAFVYEREAVLGLVGMGPQQPHAHAAVEPLLSLPPTLGTRAVELATTAVATGTRKGPAAKRPSEKATQGDEPPPADAGAPPQSQVASPWPPQQPSLLTRKAALEALFQAWDVSLEGPPSEACDFALRHDLVCLQKEGSMGLLRDLDRPAILELRDDQGERFYTALTGLNTSRVYVSAGSESWSVPLEAVRHRWTGRFTLLWRRPASYTTLVQKGAEGPIVAWLDRQLARAEGRKPPEKGTDHYDQAMVERVKTFQREAGLTADGVVGPRTIIHLNSAAGLSVPQLSH